MRREIKVGTPDNDANNQPQHPRWLIDPDCVDIEVMHDPDDIGTDPLLDDAEVYRHSRTS